MSGRGAGRVDEATEVSGGVIRVLLADDQKLVRSGFSMILSVEDDIDVVGEATDGGSALRSCRELEPDIVLMDVQMPGMDGIEATRQIVTEDLAKVIILTTFDRDDYLFAALDAGASGFLLKNTDPDHLVEGVRSVALGHALLAPEVTRRVIAARTFGRPSDRAGHQDGQGGAAPSRPAPPEPDRGRLDVLTEREREVLALIARGMSNAEIAAELFVGEATVKTHVSNVLAKLGLRDRVQAVVCAYESGLILPGD